MPKYKQSSSSSIHFKFVFYSLLNLRAAQDTNNIRIDFNEQLNAITFTPAAVLTVGPLFLSMPNCI